MGANHCAQQCCTADAAQCESPVLALQAAFKGTNESPGDIFVARLYREPQVLMGLRVDTNDGRTAHIVYVLPEGLARRYNDAACEDEQSEPGQYIVEVNGISGDSAAMLKAIEESSVVTMRVSKAITFELFVARKPGEQLGLFFAYESMSQSLIVREIREGPIARHNRTAPPGRAVLVYDRVLQVNSVDSGALALLAELGASPIVTLTFSRPFKAIARC